MKNRFEFDNDFLNRVSRTARIALGSLAAVCVLTIIRWFIPAFSELDVATSLGRFRVDTAFFILTLVVFRELGAFSEIRKIRLLRILLLFAVTLLSVFNLANPAFHLFEIGKSWSSSPAVSVSLSLFVVSEYLRVLKVRGHEKSGVVLHFVGFVVAASAEVGYLFGAESIRALPFFNQISFSASINLMFYAFFTPLLTPKAGWLPILTSQNLGSRLLRKTLPGSMLMVALSTVVISYGSRSGWYDGRYTLNLMILNSFIIFGFALLFIGLQLNSMDRARNVAFQNLQDTETELQQAQSLAKVGSWILYDGERAAKWSPQLYEIFGVPAGQKVLPETVEMHLDPSVLKGIREQMQRCLANGEAFETQHEIIRRDGSRRTVHGRAERMIDPVSGRRSIHGTIHDISEIQAMVDQLRTAERLYNDLYNESPDMLLSVDLGTSLIEKCNRTLLRNLGYQEDEVVGQPILKLYDFASQATIPALMRNLAQQGEIRGEELVVVAKDGRSISVSLNSSLVRDEAGAPKFSRSVWRDISDFKNAQEALIRERAAAESSRLKSSFISTMSHEIRTPLNGVVGMSEILMTTQLDPIQRDYADTIKRSADTLMILVNDILDFSKIESGRIEMELIDFDIESLLTDIEKQMSWAAARKKLSLSFQSFGSEDRLFSGDRHRLQQILVNLVSNAIKFTSTGEVAVRVKATEIRNEVGLLNFEVVDTGIGMSALEQEQLFQPFSQIKVSNAHGHGGTGLGLSISQNLVKLMGGRIHVESKRGAGSRFYFELQMPYRQRKEKVQLDGQVIKSHFTDRPRILVAEDSDVNQKVFRLMLKELNCDIEVVEDGMSAIRQLTENGPFDLLLMDCQMPGVGGIEATELIRLHGSSQIAATKIIAVTANASVEDRAACLRAGMSDYLSKPLTLNSLSQVLNRWVDMKPTSIVRREILNSESAEPVVVQFRMLRELNKVDNEHPNGFVSELLELFESRLPDRMHNLREAQRRGDNQDLARQAHALKSSASSFGAQAIGLACDRIGEAAKHGQFDQANLIINELPVLSANMAEQIRSWIASAAS